MYKYICWIRTIRKEERLRYHDITERGKKTMLYIIYLCEFWSCIQF